MAWTYAYTAYFRVYKPYLALAVDPGLRNGAHEGLERTASPVTSPVELG